MDALKNLATSTVATAPSPATSGTSVVVAAGTGSRFPAAPFDVTFYAPGVRPDPSNAEIARCTAVSTDTLTLVRAQYGTTAQSVAVGWYVDNDVTANLLGQFAALSGATFTGAVSGTTFTGSGEISGTDFKATGLTGATTARRFVGGTTAGAPVSGTFSVGDFIIDNSATIWVCTVAGSPGTWSPTEPLTLTRRSATATAFPGEVTVFNGSTASQTITLPSTPVEGSRYFMVNNASVTVNILGGTNSLSIAGTTYSALTPFTVLINAWYSFVYDATGIWYAVDTNNLSQAVGTLAVANGGTGVTTSTGSGSVVLSASPTLTTPSISSIVNTGTLTLPTSTDTLVGRSTTDTLTNKRITKRVLALSANSATPAINTDNYDVVHITAQTAAITGFTMSGTPVDGDTLRVSITGTAAVAITWGTSFEASTVTLPTTTTGTARLDVGFFWNTETSKFRCVAVA